MQPYLFSKVSPCVLNLMTLEETHLHYSWQLNDDTQHTT